MYGPAPEVWVPSLAVFFRPSGLITPPTTSSWVSRVGRSGLGFGVLMTTVSGPVAVNVSPAKSGTNWPPDLRTYPKWSATTCAVSDEPSENFTPDRSCSSSWVLSPTYRQDVASPGCRLPSERRTISGWYASA